MTRDEFKIMESEFVRGYTSHFKKSEPKSVPETEVIKFATKVQKQLSDFQYLLVEYVLVNDDGSKYANFEFIDKDYDDRHHMILDRRRSFIYRRGLSRFSLCTPITTVIWLRGFDRYGAVTIKEIESFVVSIKLSQDSTIKRSLLKELWGVRKINDLYNLEVDNSQIKVLESPHSNQFFKKMEAMGDKVQVRRLYHGTNSYNLPKIIRNGFKLGSKGGAFGNGVYFGEIDKARTYSDKECLLIECEIIYTNVYNASMVLNTKGKEVMHSADCDILYYSGFTRPEYVVYDINQIHINRIIKAR